MRNLHVFKTIAIDPETDECFTFFAIGFDVNIGSPLSIGIGDDLIGQPYDGIVVFVEPATGLLRRSLLSFADELAENVGDIFI